MYREIYLCRFLIYFTGAAGETIIFPDNGAPLCEYDARRNTYFVLTDKTRGESTRESERATPLCACESSSSFHPIRDQPLSRADLSAKRRCTSVLLHRSREELGGGLITSLARYKYIHSHRRTFDDLRSGWANNEQNLYSEFTISGRRLLSRASDGRRAAVPRAVRNERGPGRARSVQRERTLQRDAPKGTHEARAVRGGRAAGNWFSVSEERTNCQTVTSPS